MYVILFCLLTIVLQYIHQYQPVYFVRILLRLFDETDIVYTQRYAYQTHLHIIVASNYISMQPGVHDAFMATFQWILNINIWA